MLSIISSGALHFEKSDKKIRNPCEYKVRIFWKFVFLQSQENKITIQASSGLSEEEIQKMVQDAEAHAEEDKKAAELVGARNNADAMIHSVKKSLTEAGDKIEASEKEKIEGAIKAVEESLASDDKAKIDEAVNNLMTASQKIGEMMYKDAGASAGDTAGQQHNHSAEENASGAKDNVIDAEYTEEPTAEKRS